MHSWDFYHALQVQFYHLDIRMHTKEKPFQCEYYGKGFTKESHKNPHQRETISV